MESRLRQNTIVTVIIIACLGNIACNGVGDIDNGLGSLCETSVDCDEGLSCQYGMCIDIPQYSAITFTTSDTPFPETIEQGNNDGGDGAGELCSPGYENECCRKDDPCGKADDGRCDCLRFCSWDDADCNPEHCEHHSECETGCCAVVDALVEGVGDCRPVEICRELECSYNSDCELGCCEETEHGFSSCTAACTLDDGGQPPTLAEICPEYASCLICSMGAGHNCEQDPDCLAIFQCMLDNECTHPCESVSGCDSEIEQAGGTSSEALENAKLLHYCIHDFGCV